MYIVPIVQKEIHNSAKKVLIKCALFLDKNGTSCMTMDDSISADSFCKANDLVMKGSPFERDGILFVNIDTEKTDMNSFYTWSEVLPNTLPMREVWRPFIWNNEPTDTWGVNSQLFSVECGEKYNIGQILTAYFKTN